MEVRTENVLYQYRTPPQTVTGVSPSGTLMGRKLVNKLAKMQVNAERNEKWHADKMSGAEVSNVEWYSGKQTEHAKHTVRSRRAAGRREPWRQCCDYPVRWRAAKGSAAAYVYAGE